MQIALNAVAPAQNSDGDGQVERRRLFLDVGGGEVDEELVAGEGVAGVEDGAVDALDGFFDGGLRESDDGRLFKSMCSNIITPDRITEPGLTLS